jgi:hypothetical protein
VARRIDADADELDSAPLELLVVPSKADQLPVAVRSPVTPVEDEHQGTLGVPAAQLEGLLRSSGSTKAGNSPRRLCSPWMAPFGSTHYRKNHNGCLPGR